MGPVLRADLGGLRRPRSALAVPPRLGWGRLRGKSGARSRGRGRPGNGRAGHSVDDQVGGLLLLAPGSVDPDLERSVRSASQSQTDVRRAARRLGSQHPAVSRQRQRAAQSSRPGPDVQGPCAPAEAERILGRPLHGGRVVHLARRGRHAGRYRHREPGLRHRLPAPRSHLAYHARLAKRSVLRPGGQRGGRPHDLGDNAVRFYKLDKAKLQAVANEVGPTVEEVLEPATSVSPELQAWMESRELYRQTASV